MNKGAPIIASLVDVRRSFTQGAVTIDVLCGVNLQIRSGELIGLLGPSGTGKSTLLQALGLLEGGFSGSIRIDDTETRDLDADALTDIRRDKLGFVYQFHHLLPDFNALENVVLPQLIAGFGKADAEDRAQNLLTRLGLGERLEHKPSKLSGGEQQRVAVARALANKPKLVLADEPTGNLDEHTADIVLEEFMSLVREEGSAAVVATHNERLAKKMDRIVRLHEGVLT
jgi:lipoprotein-releasing system ATP-binding protein